MNKESLISQLDQVRASSAVHLDNGVTHFVRLISTRGPVELSRSPLIEVTADEWQHFLRYKMDRIERQPGPSSSQGPTVDEMVSDQPIDAV